MWGTKGGFLPENTPFRGIGLAFSLLRAVQLLACCYGSRPSLYVQVRLDTALAVYLRGIGFNIVRMTGLHAAIADLAVDSPGYAEFKEKCPPDATDGIVWRNGEGLVVLECTEVVRWSRQQSWKPELFESYRYHHSAGQTGLSTFPQDCTLFHYPIATDGLFQDQCARGLSFLGLPFFYCHDQTQLIGDLITSSHMETAVI